MMASFVAYVTDVMPLAPKSARGDQPSKIFVSLLKIKEFLDAKIFCLFYSPTMTKGNGLVTLK